MGVRWLAPLLAGALALAGCGERETERDWPEPSPALWEVRAPAGAGGASTEATGWLFGTIHALPADAEWRTPALEAALARSGVLVVEVADLGDARAAAEAYERRAHSSGLPPLSERVPTAERPALKRALEDAGLSDDAFAEVETWAASLQLASALRDHDSADGVDRALIEEAPRVIGLESFDEQFALFDTMAPKAQAHLLIAVARENATDQDQRVAAWLTGDLDRLERDAAGGLLADPVLRERLQLARNRAWAGHVEALIAAGERPFVAVGTAHMFGEEGLPALLRAGGYKVARIQ